jgi:hypothetical protein
MSAFKPSISDRTLNSIRINNLFAFPRIHAISATSPGYAALWLSNPVVSLARNHRLLSSKPSA